LKAQVKSFYPQRTLGNQR